MAKKKYVEIIINLIVVILGTIAICMQIFQPVDVTNGVNLNGLDAFRYFTNDGNIYCIIASFVALIFDALLILNKYEKKTNTLYLIKLASAVTSAIIFFVVIFLLVPTLGWGLLSGFTMIVLHVINPILCVIGFLLFDKSNKKIKIIELFIGAAPVFVYGILAMILCFGKVWSDKLIPYPFLRVYENPAWATMLYMIGIFGGTIGFSWILNFLNKKISL